MLWLRVHWRIAHLVEHTTDNGEVDGSSPSVPTNLVSICVISACVPSSEETCCLMFHALVLSGRRLDRKGDERWATTLQGSSREHSSSMQA